MITPHFLPFFLKNTRNCGAYFIYILFYLILFILSISLFTQAHGAPSSIFQPALVQEHKKTNILKEIKALKKDVKAFQDKIDQISQKVQLEAPFLMEKKKDKKNFLVKDIERFVTYLNERAYDFYKGAHSLVNLLTLNIKMKEHTTAHFAFSLFSSIFGIFFLLTIGFFIKRPIASLHQRIKNDTTKKLIVVSSFLFLPLSFLAFIATIFSDIFKTMGYQHTTWTETTFSAFIPFHIYIIVSAIHWIFYVLSPMHTTRALINLGTDHANKIANQLKLSIFLYAFTAFFLNLSEFFIIEKVVLDTLLDAGVIGVGLLLLSALSYIRKNLSTGKDRSKEFNFILSARILITASLIFWIIGKKAVIYFLGAVFSTSMIYLFFMAFAYSAHACFIRIMWQSRASSKLIKTLFKNKIWIRKTGYYIFFAIVIVIWVPYFDSENEEFYLFLSQWFSSIIESTFITSFVNAVMVFFGAFFVTKGCEKLLAYYVEEKYASDSAENNFLASRLKTLMAMLKTILRFIIWLPAISVISSQFGKSGNVTPWISSISVASVGLTFGVQNIIRDFITGFFIILENNLMVGDDVDIDGKSGKVEGIALRTLKIRADNGTLLTIPFGSISVIGNKNRGFTATIMNISIGYKDDPERAQNLIEKAFNLLKINPFLNRQILGPMEIRGITEVTHYSVVIQIKIKTAPNTQELIRRSFTRHLKTLFDEAGIVVPTPPHSVTKASPSLTQTNL